MAKVTKAVIPAAGFGTRFLPQTKAMPKEMLPLVDKPVIQYVVEELVAAGITDIIIVGNSSKRSIEDHFDLPNEDLLVNLRAGGEKKQHYIDEMEAIAGLANFMYLRQRGPYGTGAPILTAARAIGNEPFIYVFTDDIITAERNPYKQMIDLYDELGGSIISCMQVRSDADYDRFGIVSGDTVRDGVIRMTGIVEQPGKDAAPSTLASLGGFVLDPALLKYIEIGLKSLPPGKEFRLNESIIIPMARDGHPFYGVQLQGLRYYDTGNPLEYLKTVFDFALQHPDVSEPLREHLRMHLND